MASSDMVQLQSFDILFFASGPLLAVVSYHWASGVRSIRDLSSALVKHVTDGYKERKTTIHNDVVNLIRERFSESSDLDIVLEEVDQIFLDEDKWPNKTSLGEYIMAIGTSAAVLSNTSVGLFGVCLALVGAPWIIWPNNQTLAVSLSLIIALAALMVFSLLVARLGRYRNPMSVLVQSDRRLADVEKTTYRINCVLILVAIVALTARAY